MATGDVRHIIDMILNSDNQLPLPFTQTPILVNGQDMMHRIFYVDAENGDDNNDGSSSAPFRTIKKACDSVPIGGYGEIRFLSDIDMTISVLIRKKFILIKLNNYSFNLKVSSQSQLYKFNGAMCALLFMGPGKIVLPTRTDDTTKLHDHPNLLSSLGNGDAFKSLALAYDVEVVVNDDAYRLLEVNINSTSAFSVHGTLTDNTGNNLTWSNLIAGIVKDANGVPRNIVSNVVF